MRLLMPKLVVVLIFMVLIGRLYQLQLIDAEVARYRYATASNTTRYVPIRPFRGEVYASDGRTLVAESSAIYTVAIRASDLPAVGTYERAQVFAELSQVLGITNTLTISPAIVLKNDQVLRDALATKLAEVQTTDFKQAQRMLPMQLPVPKDALFGATQIVERHAPLVRFIPRYNAPIESEDAAPLRDVDSALSDLSSALDITGTLVISPATQIALRPELRSDLIQIFGEAVAPTIDQIQIQNWLLVDIPPRDTVAALQLSQQFSRTLSLDNPIDTLVRTSDTPRYQTIVVKRDIPRKTAMVIRENAGNLPGVVIEQDYRRRYPLSDDVQSLSHVLGYVGRVGSCELVRQNPARSWVVGLLDSIGHAVECGIIQKKVNRYELGIPRDRKSTV